MDRQVEFLPLLYYGFIEQGKQYMHATIELRLGGNKQSMVFSGIATNNCGGRIRTGPV
jgi:hypothetical protein